MRRASSHLTDSLSRRPRVLFVRLDRAVDTNITDCLALYYAHGWRVVSHAESPGEYSFVLEQPSR